MTAQGARFLVLVPRESDRGFLKIKYDVTKDVSPCSQEVVNKDPVTTNNIKESM